MSGKKLIKLGPLLGIEGDYFYTVTFLSDLDMNLVDIALNIGIKKDNYEEIIKCECKETLNKSFIYKFTFSVEASQHNKIVDYSISHKGEAESNQYLKRWQFEVPGQDIVPRIGIASCNGEGSVYPDPNDKQKFAMWTRLRNKFVIGGDSIEVFPFHCLLLTGDQIYADPIWDEISYFKQHKLLGWRSFYRSSKKIAKHKIPKEERAKLEQQLNDFYEDIYVRSWSNIDIAATLSSVPSVMMWDDHDIFDGWGSHSEDLQKSDIFQLIFSVANKYFEKLQVRGSNNKTRICLDRSEKKNHYSSRLSFRNFEILTLDNRSLRTQAQVMSGEQYKELESIAKGDTLFSATKDNEELANQKTILFVVPVPIAHLDYSTRSESFLNIISRFNFELSFSLADDTLDHWSHDLHKIEQKRLFDLMYRFGEKSKPKYIHIISGDVHSAGVGRIKKLKHGASKQNPSGIDYLRINQLVSSAIVHSPASKLVQKTIERITKQTQSFDDYDIWIDDYGIQDMPKTIYDRNFAYLEKREKQGLKYYLELENSTSTTGGRNINNEEADYNFDQPAKFENSTAND